MTHEYAKSIRKKLRELAGLAHKEFKGSAKNNFTFQAPMHPA
jgi:hypothetical protein